MLTRLRHAALVTALLLAGACSYTFTIGPHQASLGGAPAGCTTSRVPPVVDTVLAVAASVAAAAALYACAGSAHDSDDSACVRAALLAPPAAVSALVYGLSAHRGFADTAACAREPSLTTASAD